MNVGFLITAYDQKREVKFTVDMLRNKWKRTANSPISIVISGDPDRTLKFPRDELTRTTSLDDIVGKDFNKLVSTSIMKQIRHGMIELDDLERVNAGWVDFVVHMHGDILLLNEDGFFDELSRFANSKFNVAADLVSPQKSDYIHFDGTEIMPQLFAVRRDFIGYTKFMFDMKVIGELEQKSTEWALKGNLVRRIYAAAEKHAWFSEKEIIESNVLNVCPNRQQWGLHKHWGGFCHFGNQLHYPQEVREARNLAALQAYGIDLSSW